jgi:MFS family permease
LKTYINSRFYSVFPAFKERNYRLHFIGQLISISGMWLQLMAQSWLVNEITHSAFWVGFIVALPLGISSALTPIGGIVADRFDKRKVLYFTQIAVAIQCALLAIMEFSKHESLGSMVAINCLFGIIMAIDGPTRNSFIPDLIENHTISEAELKEKIGSGTALNGAMVMTAMMLGPGFAGSLLGRVGVGWTFIASSLATLGVMATLPLMRIVHVHKKPQEHPIRMFWLGVKYTVADPVIRLCVVLAGLIGMFGFSYRALLPVITKEVYKAGMGTMGNLMLAAGFGSLIGSVLVSANSKNLPFNRLVIGGTLMAGISLILFAMTSILSLGMFLLFLAGIGFTLSFSTVRAKSQIVSEKKLRGRVTGFTMMLFFMGMSIGNLSVGFLAKKFGCPAALTTSGIAFLVLSASMFMFGKNVNVSKPVAVQT